MRDRDASGRPRNARRRDDLGRPVSGPGNPAPPPDAAALPPQDALRTAQQLLDDGRPFAAHEVLEAVWKADSTDSRDLWRGLAQLAVGITHAGRGNRAGARSLLDRSAVTLSPYAGRRPHGVAVDAVREWARCDDGTGRPPRLVG